MKKILFVLLVSLILLSCSDEDADGDEGDLPFSTVYWKSDGNGFIQFSTNDPNVHNFAFTYIFTNNNNQIIFEIECKKNSGNRRKPFGMIFGAQDNQSFYSLIIDTEGFYSIWKYNNNYIVIKEWIKSERLNTGYGKSNNLKVIKNSSTFTVYLNDHQVHQFTDSTINGNRIGYYVSIGSEEEESFPNNPVDVRFRQR